MRHFLYLTLSLLLLPGLVGPGVPPAGAEPGMVSFTFDDGLASTWKHAFPILRQHQQKATVGIICSRLFMQDDDYMTTEQALELQRSGWEIASHSLTHKRPSDIPLYYSDEQVTGWKLKKKRKYLYEANYEYPAIACLLENGAAPLKELSALDEVKSTPGSFYFDRVVEQLHVRPHRGVRDPKELNIRSCSYQREMEFSKLELEKLGFKITTYITPYNQWNDAVQEMGSTYYGCVATGFESENRPGAFDPFCVKRFNVYRDTTVSSLTRLVKEHAVKNNAWVVFCLHEIEDDVGWEPWTAEKLTRLCAWLQEQQVRVVTISEGVAAMKAAAPAAPH